MKTLLTICALAAGAGLAATSETAQADHCSRGYGGYGGGYGGGYYSSPSYGYAPSYGHNHYGHNHYGYQNRGYNRGYNSGYGYGGYGYGGRSGFSVRTPGFGLYVR